jgi:phosphatidylglycerol:prolipoprotein diacylglycerol transferase
MITLGILTVIGWALWRIRRGAAVTYDEAFTVAIVGIISGVVFSRLLHVIDRWDLYADNLWRVFGGGGFTIYGAVLGATLGIWIYSRFTDFKFGYFVDMIAPAIILAQAIGRVGCLINGCCFGYETTVPWAIIYLHPNALCTPGVAVHPTQAYEIIYNLLVFGVLLALRGRLKPDGSLFMVYLGLYSLWRVIIDFWRVGTPFFFDLHQAQIIGLIVLFIVVPLLIFKTHWVRSEGEETDAGEEESA